MTPEPDPPVPSTLKYYLICSDGYNNAHMLRVLQSSNDELLTGTKIDLVTPVTLTVEFPDDGTNYGIKCEIANYNNQYPNYDDSYYNDIMQSVTLNSASRVILTQYASGTSFTLVYDNNKIVFNRVTE